MIPTTGKPRAAIRRTLAAAAAGLTFAAVPASAPAQSTHEVFADDTAGTSVWAPDEVQAAVGDTVRWRIDAPRANVFHDLEIDMPTGDDVYWAGGNPQGGPVTPFEQVFEAAGTYPFVCTIHTGTMNGTVIVGGGGPGGPGPGGGDALPNPTQPPAVFEVGDNRNPKLSHLRARGLRHGVRLRFVLSEPGGLSVKIVDADGAVAAKKRLRKLGQGSGSGVVRARRLEPGRYVVRARAIDRAGNRAPAQKARVRIR